MYKTQKVGAIIVAAGCGMRMDGIDKIFAPLGDMSVLEHSVTTFDTSPYVDFITVVLRHDNTARGEYLLRQKSLRKELIICQGGARRQDSALAGLNALPPCRWVIVHDGARPLLNQNLIADGLEASQETGAAAAAVPLTDTVKRTDDNGYVNETLPRKLLWAVQTPQVFRFDIIKAGYTQTVSDVTDDAAMVEALGIKVKLYTGSYDNVKLTTPTDMALAQSILQQRRP
ncbi:MAG: 2-C-methyl-D-erythritol 4-phosphate cytidylyltransferase [Dehalococcoidia bacterium]|nr:2-C-methyl-D-erythritol 4-phosphate cytidylyltransferase [Dehalococcoidia bacterium]